MSIPTEELVEKVEAILAMDPNHYRLEMFNRKHVCKNYADRRIANEYYSIIRALHFVAHKYFKADHLNLLSEFARTFWSPNEDYSKSEWFIDKLLIEISYLRKEVLELHYDKISFSTEAYLKLNEINYEIKVKEYKIDFLLQVYQYVSVYDWKVNDYFSINVYEQQFDSLPMIKLLSENGISLEDIIDDINLKKQGFFTIAMLWHIGLIKRLKEQSANVTKGSMAKTIYSWLSPDAKQNIKSNTFEKYIGYMEDRGNYKPDEFTPGYETQIDIIEKRYKTP
jgi:hypothetical protein